MDMAATIIPKSDQINADDLIAAPVTVTIEKVSAGSAEQPVDVHLVEFPGRVYRPSKSMRRVMVAAWGSDTAAYMGQRLTLFREPSIKFGADPVGGIRIAAMTGIDKPLKVALTVTRGKREPFVVQPLSDSAPRREGKSADTRAAKMAAAFADFGVTPEQLDQRIGRPAVEWTDDDLAQLRDIGSALKAGTTNVTDEFGRTDLDGGAE